MIITKIKLVAEGFKGLEVEYKTENVKDGKPVLQEYFVETKHPIHKALETLFRDLRIHLLYRCDLTFESDSLSRKGILLNETEVRAVKYEDGITIFGAKEVSGGRVYKLDTPITDETDGYENYGNLLKLVHAIIEETKLYMSGEVKVSEEEIITRWIEAGKAKDMSIDLYEGMDTEEKRELRTRELQKIYGKPESIEEIDIEDMELTAAPMEIHVEENETVIPITGRKQKIG